jgi:hypothetical protein
MKEKNYIELLQKNTTTGIDTKFYNKTLRDILVSTGNSILIWNDSQDNFLGVGEDNKGNNFVGKYLSILREKIIIEHDNQNEQLFKKFSSETVHELLSRDTFVKTWIRLKTRDICNIVSIMKIYVKDKINYDINIDDDFINIILNNIYYKCSRLYHDGSTIHEEHPAFYKNIVNSNKNFENSSTTVINSLWSVILSLLYRMDEVMKQTDIKNTKVLIIKANHLINNCIKNRKIISLNTNDNNIISAIINILKGIVHFNKYYTYSSDITKHDIICAYSILVGKYIPVYNVNEIVAVETLNIGWNDHETVEINDYHILYNEVIGLLKQNFNMTLQNNVKVVTEEIINNLTYIKNNNLLSSVYQTSRICFFAT